MSGSPFHLQSLWRRKVHGDDFGPWFHLWGQAVYAHTAAIGVAVCSMLFTTVAITLKTGWLEVLRFGSEAVLERGEIWRILSYAVWNPPSIDFAVQMLVLWWFGREIEGFFGRRTFLHLFLGMLLVPTTTALAMAQVPVLGPSELIGLSGVSISLQFLVAYATLSPQVSFFYGIPIKWVATAVSGVVVLTALANHNWSRLVLDLTAIGFAFGFVRNRMGLLELPTLQMPSWIRKKPVPTFTVVKQQTAALHSAPGSSSDAARPQRGGPPVRTEAGVARRTASDALDAIDPLLEKISQSGMASLTAEEKTALLQAREALLRESAEDRDTPR